MSKLRKQLASPMIRIYTQYSVGQLRRRNRNKATKEVFTEIYKENLWGGKNEKFYSGSGSTEKITESYVQMVRDFINSHNIKDVVDLGCGDFRVGYQLQMENVHYIGVDIVDELIAHNISAFSDSFTRFECLDIIQDDLPKAELCLIRQVLQHLSNDQIAKVLEKVRTYNWVIVTEHYPPDNMPFKPNLDKPHGGDTRIYDGSAVYLDYPPFSMKFVQQLLEVNLSIGLLRKNEKIKSFLITN